MRSNVTLSKPARVLLVDDNEGMLKRAAAVLAPACDVVGAVHDGVAALQAVSDVHPDVIVLDISMSGMNGFEVADRVRRNGSTAAIVFLTVHVEEEFVAAAKAAGGIGYVVKSRIASDLKVAVQEASAGRPFNSPILLT
jgi:DNA-binding NarL/FixJ family response regulator